MTDHKFHGFLALQGRGVLSLPADLRKRMHMDEPGAQIEILERDGGVLELRTVLPVPAAEKWFWDERWQVGELAVDEHVSGGRETFYENDEDFLASLPDS